MGISKQRELLAEVDCPVCDDPTSVRMPEASAEPVVRRSVALFGEHSEVECARGHRFWVYYC